MMVLSVFFTVSFIVIAFSASVILAWKALEIFVPKEVWSNKSRAWRFHQFWFNFVGSVSGWVALWFVVRSVWMCLSQRCLPEPGIWDATIAAVALVGITGYLPYTMMGVLERLQGLANRALGG